MIVEKAERSDIPDIDKKKLVPFFIFKLLLIMYLAHLIFQTVGQTFDCCIFYSFLFNLGSACIHGTGQLNEMYSTNSKSVSYVPT